MLNLNIMSLNAGQVDFRKEVIIRWYMHYVEEGLECKMLMQSNLS